MLNRHFRCTTLCLAFTLFFSSLYSQIQTQGYSYLDKDIAVFDFAQDEKGTHIFIPPSLLHNNPSDSTSKIEPAELIVFVHGYGALNPMIYGQWIRHLVKQNYVVIYPRYQTKILSPPAKEFSPNVVSGINLGISKLVELNILVDTSSIHLVGHSYGGVIITDLAENYKSFQIPKPASLFICQPGTGLLKGGVLDTYSNIPPELPTVIMVGDNDKTVGAKFGDYIWDKIDQVNEKVYIHQHESDTFNLTSSHYEPYAIDTLLDNKYENYTSKKAIRVSKFDDIDTGLYWPIFDELIRNNNRKIGRPLSHSIHDIATRFDYTNGLISVDIK